MPLSWPSDPEGSSNKMPQTQPLGSHLEHTQPHATAHCMYRSSSCVTQTHTHTHTHTHTLASGSVAPYTSWCSILLFYFLAHHSGQTHHYTLTHTHTHTDSVTQTHRHTPILSLIPAPPGTHTPVQSLTHSHAHCHTQTHIHTESDTHRHTVMAVHTAGRHLHICAP